MLTKQVNLDLIDDNPFQPRSVYSPATIAEIAHSIKEVGLIHPPIAREVDGRYQICEGHLRLRAYRKLHKAQPKNWAEMPLDVREVDDREMALIALEENLRRKDITPIDVARAVDKYMTSFTDVTEKALGEKMGMAQPTIANMRRVLTLPAKILEKIDEGKLSFSMGKELLVFKGLQAEGDDQRFNRTTNKYDHIPRDEEWLMLQAIHDLGRGGYNPLPETVDGLKKAIFNVCSSQFKRLYKVGTGYYDDGRNPLFNVEKAGCAKCEHCIKAFETKKEGRPFCTDHKCWEKLQKKHREQMAIKAKEQLEADVAQRLAAVKAKVEAQAAGGPADGAAPAAEIPQGIPEPKLSADERRALQEMNAVHEEQRQAEQPGFATVDEVCSGCINRSKCDRSMMAAKDIDGHSAYYCPSRLTKKDTAALADKVKKVPAAVQEKIKEAAGTRAEVLDIHDLKLGNYGGDLKGGYVLLNGRYTSILDQMLDSPECTERCTKGFHFGYDSGATGMYDKDELTRVHFVCTNPKCVAQKKAAFTRHKNAEGMARKKAEAKAIGKVADATTQLDLPRVKLIFYASLFGKHTHDSYSYGRAGLTDFLMARCGIKRKDTNSREKADAVWKYIDKQTDVVALQKLLVEAMLNMLTDDPGNIQQYKIQTTQVLNWFGVAPQVEPVKDEPAQEDKEPEPVTAEAEA